MKTFSLFTLLAALGVGTVSILRADYQMRLRNSNQALAQATDGAFRDGLYLGKLAAESGAGFHVAIGRWATLEDRSSFTAGYERAYNEFLASRAASSSASRPE
jgi:hypothetical protein